MMNEPGRQPIPFDRPGVYQISVQGQIDEGSLDLLQGMTVRRVRMSAGKPFTTLEGELSDQAALAGVLVSLYELHLTLVKVKRLDTLDH